MGTTKEKSGQLCLSLGVIGLVGACELLFKLSLDELVINNTCKDCYNNYVTSTYILGIYSIIV